MTLNGQLSKIDSAGSYPDPSFLALFLNAYNTTYQWNRPLTDFFKQPYATNIPSLLDGTHTITQINQGLNTDIKSILNPDFYVNLNNPGGESRLKAQLTANSFPGWFPKSPTRLYHGTADEDVFFQTSQTTYNRFIAAGSTQLTLIPIPGGTHETSAGPMLMDAFSWMESLDQYGP